MPSHFEIPASIARDGSFEKQTNTRGVESVVRDYDVFIVHGVQPNFTPSNSILRAEATWIDKLEILLALQPPVSASTISRNDTAENMWARIGVVFAGGKIISANPVDARTVPKTISGDRSELMPDTDIEQAVRNAILNRPSDQHNELVVQSPEVVALYWSADTGYKQNRVSYEDLRAFSQKNSLPLFVLHRGRLIDQEGARNPQTKKFEEVSKEALLKLPRGLNPSQRKHILEKLHGNDSPFRFEKIQDGRAVDSAGYGRMAYVELADLAEKKPGEIGRFPIIGKQICYVSDESGTLYRIEKKIGVEKEQKESVSDSSSILNSLNTGYVELSGHETIRISERIGGPTDYVDALRSRLLRPNTESGEVAQQHQQKYSDFLRRIAFHLHGFATQAREMNDLETYRLAKKAAEVVVSEDEFVHTLQTRLDTNGGFHITKDDIGNGV